MRLLLSLLLFASTFVANAAPRADKRIYCAEDERIAGTTSNDYRLSAVHLRVPTVGERLKRAEHARMAYCALIPGFLPLS